MLEAARDRDFNDGEDLLVTVRIFSARTPRLELFRHAIEAPFIATVGDGDAEIIDRARPSGRRAGNGGQGF